MTESTHRFLTTFELRMPNLTPQYFDRTYYLEIENSEGKKTLAFLLRERGAPKPPRNLTAVWTDDSSVHLSWIPGFHGGKPQTFVVQYQDITKKDSFNQIWKSVPTKFQETQDESPKQMTLGGLQPGSSYNICVHAMNEYGNSTSVTLTIATLATAASSADGGTIAGAVIAVIIIVAIIVLVLVYVFVIRPRRNKDDTKDDTGEPMLSDSDKQTSVTAVAVADEKPLHSTPADTTNNNANADASVEPPETTQTQPRDSPDNHNRNQDGLIYADLQLAKSRDSTPVPERKDAVNYDVIDFTRKAPEPGPDDIEVVPDEEPLYANK